MELSEIIIAVISQFLSLPAKKKRDDGSGRFNVKSKRMFRSSGEKVSRVLKEPVRSQKWSKFSRVIKLPLPFVARRKAYDDPDAEEAVEEKSVKTRDIMREMRMNKRTFVSSKIRKFALNAKIPLSCHL